MQLHSTYAAFSPQVLMAGLVPARRSHASACAHCMMQIALYLSIRAVCFRSLLLRCHVL